jgi:hypothetical protein
MDPFGELVMKAVVTHDGGRVVGGDWSGDIRLLAAGDGRLIAHLASNPPKPRSHP